jgi:hypothetical protein
MYFLEKKKKGGRRRKRRKKNKVNYKEGSHIYNIFLVRFEPVLENKETIYFKWRPTAFGVTRN